MENEWGQTGIYGQFCPNGISGCSATALGLVITYFNDRFTNPTFKYTYPGADIESEEIDWKRVLQHKRSASYRNGVWTSSICYESNPDEQHKTIGRVLRQIGYEGNANYNSQYQTGMSKSSYKGILAKHLPSLTISDFKEYNPSAVQRDIDRGLVLMRSNEASGGGHVWVADAYRWIYFRNYVRTLNEKNNTWSDWSYTEVHQHYSYFHWGWEGNDDGFFDGSVFNVQSYSFNAPEYIAVTYR